MEMGRLLNGVMNFCKWVTHFAVLNLMWIGCTLLGGVIFGIAPSTVAMYAISRKAVEGEGEIHVVRLFWCIFRKEFFRANGLAGVLTVFGLLWYFDMHFFRQFEGGIYTVMDYFMMILGLVYIILLMYILPVYVHYDLKLFQYFKQALMIGFLRPGNLILMLVCVLSTYYFFISFPGFIPIFGFTIFAHLNMWLAFKCFESIEEVSVDMT
ncbi:YesL family protein [Pseudalkalibacillus salsuginis]|uniref:YesL family protein n=1 Tax=Pseudalkalibacillus salsuginis TaxID=2910972 RepID=UPI001F3D3510|nr:YesL family protein [Pseudalkalibacillus salsuginis]MCF6408427.1 YesL family protein [Pseudalkalibacillus salsuginis]